LDVRISDTFRFVSLNIFALGYNTIMNKKIDHIAFHEAGHAVGHVLAGLPFKYVTIKEEKEKDQFGFRSLGQVANENPMTPEEWEKHSIMNPVEFNTFFKDDFTKLAGLVAEGICRGRFNYKAAKGDFRQWVGNFPQPTTRALKLKIY
jgi:hypothetical protein